MSDESVVKVFEDQQVGTLKLSDAIRVGARKTPKCAGMFFQGRATCAIGAAWVGIGGGADDARGCFNFALSLKVPPGMKSEIYHRNDSGQSREQIADWLEAQGY
jgi:hypothetical protein